MVVNPVNVTSIRQLLKPGLRDRRGRRGRPGLPARQSILLLDGLVSTGTAWGGSIPAADVALLNVANSFTANQSISGNLNVSGSATVDGAIQAGSGPALYLQTPAGFPNIHSDGASLFINATNGGGTHINADEGYGCYFHNPGGAITATIDSAGNATFAALLTVAGNVSPITSPASGLVIDWNIQSGNGETDFINSAGGAGGEV